MRHPATGRRRAGSSSGSTRHDDAEHPPQSRAHPRWSIRRHQTSATPSRPTPPNWPPLHTSATAAGTLNHDFDVDPHSEHQSRAAAADTIPSIRDSQIPIARAANSSPISRGFLPWRLSDDGPGACRSIDHGPSSETLHKSGHWVVPQRASFEPREGRSKDVS